MADPYISKEDATEYFITRLNSDAWFDEPDATSADPIDRKLAALVTASNMIDQLAFRGAKTDLTQAREFPRNGDTTVPEAIQLATAEIALNLLDGVDPSLEYENLSITGQTYANIKSSYDRSSLPDHLVAGIPSVIAWRYLVPYIRNSQNIRMNRIS